MLTLGLFVVPATHLSAGEEFLVREGEAKASIVIPKEASAQLKKTAEILRDTIRQSTGAELEIVTDARKGTNLHLGPTDLIRASNLLPGDLAEDGFLLKRINPTSFAIVGKSDWGTEFGVYEFLERYLGVRWLAPTELFTEIPKAKTVLLPDVDLRIEPTFLSRELYPIVPQDEGNDPLRAQPPLWYSQADAWGRANKVRAHVEFHHNLLETLPPSRFGESHPEFFPLLNGQRMIPPDDLYYEWQPNFSAPALVEVMAEEIIRHFDQHPERSSFSLGINDSKRFDQSPESKARRSGKTNSMGLEDVSDDYFQWANEVAALVHQKHPGKLFGVLAYLNILEPPTRVKLSPSIVPFITYELTRWEDPRFRDVMQNLTLAWGKAAPVLGWYDYVYGLNYMVPRFFPHAEQKALSWGAKHQVKYYFAEAMPNWGEGPSLWVLTKLLWNPDQDVDALLDDWYRAAVGAEAAPALRRYYAIWEKFWNEDILTSRWYSPTTLWQDFESSTYLSEVPASYLEESEKLMAEVVARADNPERKRRAESLQKMWTFYRASVVARQGDDLWKAANLQTDADAAAYVKQCEIAIQDAKNRLRLLGELAHDPLLGHPIWRIARSNDSGTAWGCASLWALAPWVTKNEEVRGFLERLTAQGEQAEPSGLRLVGNSQTEPLFHEAGKTAALILAASGDPSAQQLKNPSFEDGFAEWAGNPFEVSSRKAAEGRQSLEFSSSGEGLLVQSIPYQPGTYYAKFSVFAPRKVKGGEVRLSVTALNDDGVQAGPLLPTGTATLVPGEWSTFVMPFELHKLNHPASTLQVVVGLNGFAETDTLYLDDLGVFFCDREARVRRGAGPDGE